MSEIRADSKSVMILQDSPGPNTSIYASGDLIGGLMTFRKPFGTVKGRGGLIQSVTLIDQAKQSADIDVLFWDTNPANTTFTNNAALDVADADMQGLVGFASITTYAALSDNSVGQALNQVIPFVVPYATPNDGGALYAALVSRGTPTYVASTDLVLRVAILPLL